MNDNYHSGTHPRRRPREGKALAESTPSVRVVRGARAGLTDGTAAKGSPIAALLDAAGHSGDCIMRMRSGRARACSCAAHAPSSDAAVTIGLCLRFARMGAAHGVPIPPGVLRLLVEHVDTGDPAAVLVWKWLVARGQLPARAGARPKPRLVRGETR